MRKIFHLEIKSENSHKYYGSLSALCSENPNLGVSKFTLDIRNKSDRGTWFARQMVAVANYAEAFGLTFWLNNDKDYDSGEQWLVGKISLPQTEKQSHASEAERKKREEATKKTLYVYGKTKEVYIEND